MTEAVALTLDPLMLLVLALLTLALLIGAVRLLIGPTLPDRVVALDLMATIGIGLICTYSVAADDPSLLRVAIVMALLSFLGTVAISAYIERGGTR